VPLFFALDVDFLHRLPHATCMYIRKTKTKTLDDGEAYYTYRLVESVREGQQVKQRTLLNLGKDFAIEPQHWSQLTARIEQLLQDAQAQQVEVFTLADEIGVLLETAAQRYSRLIVHTLKILETEL
jgi:PleD family two-component response regulator